MKKYAFTLKSLSALRALNTACDIHEAYDPKTTNNPTKYKKVNALWDTGATNSVIDVEVAHALGLIPISRAQVCHANGTAAVNVYMVNITLPNNIMIPMLQVTEGSLSGTDVLIGMDIIGLGDFAVTHQNGGTTFSFQIPSTHDTDYVAELKSVQDE